ncbi:MAG: hypothetical protein LBS62_06245 [Clostridiales bacterium]|jgi:hypothetical protein|nr:hypothetical protein [Clostridiales bacterium]
MGTFTVEELKEAHRAILSLRNKSGKAADKLTENSWQKKNMVSVAAAADVALSLIDNAKSGPYARETLDKSCFALADALSRAEAVIGKFAPGTSQHTLQKNRIAALKLALTLIKREG